MNSLIRTEELTAVLMGRAGDAMLWLLATIHVLALSVLFLTLLSLNPANAAEEPACGGSNLLVKMQQDDPQRYQALEQEAAAVPNGKGILWRIEKDGQSPSYLLGTMHVTDPRVLGMPAGAQAAFDASQTVIVESDEILDEKKVAASLLSRPELTMFLDGKSITDLLSKENAVRLEAGLKERGIPLGAVSRMKPWMLASFVVLPACEFIRKAQGASFLDKKIAENAVASSKQLVGLETLVEQLTAMSELPMEFHLQALIETLDMGDKMQDIMATMTDLYITGDIGMTMPMLESQAPTPPDESDKKGYAAFEKRIITDRNHIMAERAASYIGKGNTFMAVGALHLSGEEGLVELFRKQGFTVTRIH